MATAPIVLEKRLVSYGLGRHASDADSNHSGGLYQLVEWSLRHVARDVNAGRWGVRIAAMPYSLLADAVVLVHLAFVIFVTVGGLLVWRWRRLAWVHLPALAWGVWIEWWGAICPLTPLENWLRARSGEQMYEGDFIQHYVLPVLYPTELTRGVQIALGALALVINVFVYWYVWKKIRTED